jgi:hypothetical protein
MCEAARSRNCYLGIGLGTLLPRGRWYGCIGVMKLPHTERVYLNIVKLRDYSLSPTHEEGKHKARVFAAALGIGPDKAEWLRDCLLKAAREFDCQLGKRDEHGQRYTIDFTVQFAGKSARLRSAWIVRAAEDFPRLVSCYVLSK